MTSQWPGPGRGSEATAPARYALVIALVAGLLLLSGCHSSAPENAETRLRNTLGSMQQAVESRDLSGLMEYVATDYHDQQERNKEQLQQIARFYLLRHRKPHVLLRIKDIQWLNPEQTRARVEAAVATAGQAIDDPGVLSSLRADLIRFDLLFVKNDNGYRLQSARWQHADPTDFL